MLPWLAVCRRAALKPVFDSPYALKSAFVNVARSRRTYATAAPPLENIRNIAIIAHVDHGKTTLVDQLLRCGTTWEQADAGTDRVMDSNTLERERGITILSKTTSITYVTEKTKSPILVNIVDTPGHADFGGEVERIMSMVDGVVLLVDATEGPMTQTRFVLDKAIKRGIKVAVVLNKADRPSSRPDQVEADLFDLFATLEASDEQIEYPVLYSSAKEGWVTSSFPVEEKKPMSHLLETVIDYLPAPTHLDRSGPFSMLIVQIEADSYVGNMFLGRVQSGTVSVGDTLWALDSETGQKVGEGKVKKLMTSMGGMQKVERESAAAGEIVSIAGIKGGAVNVTLVHPEGWGAEGPKAIETTPIDPPTISTIIYPNDGPLAGQDGSKLTSQVIKERIYKEAETNVALKVLPGPTSEAIELRGRGVLHLGILFETLRREGFEFLIGPPKPVLLPDPDNKGGWLEPVERCEVVMREEASGTVIQQLTMRKGEMVSYHSGGEAGLSDGWVKVVIDIPARGLIGYMAGEFKNDVRGEGTLNHTFLKYAPHFGPFGTSRNGSLISMAAGESSGYAMQPLQARGILFIHPQTAVYPGMVIGECNRAGSDLYLNPCIKKQLTNIRAAGADEKIVLSAPRVMGLEELVAYMNEDEMVEATPSTVRLRKRILDPKTRERMKNQKGAF
ncbi:P-loop containing nucleoside triphosphate hydrolase protein [Schizophyllum commune]